MLSYALVVVVDAAVFTSTGLYMSPSKVRNSGDTQAYQEALFTNQLEAVFIGVLVSLAVGAAATVVITRLLMKPLRHLRRYAQRLREGHYREQIQDSQPPELAALAGDLNQLAARLADVETRRARLVSDLAHELRTPLTIIQGQLVGVADGVYGLTPELLSSVREELDRLHRLTDDLSGLSRAEENAYRLHREKTDLTELVAGVTQRLRHQFDHEGVELRTSTPGPVLTHVDPDRIGQILANLLRNALAATPADGHVTIVLDRTADGVTIEVHDDGRGIAAVDLERIFERFERAEPNSTGPGGGSGIGLTIARSLARAHGGDLVASSPGPGRGARFALTLPDDSGQPGST
ncbi:sensor histidine kinase [Streptomyces sp. NPDC059627]